MRRIKRMRTSTLVIAFVALFVALGGTATASHLITGSQIQNESISGKDVKNNSLTGKDVKEGSLGTVPNASNAQNASRAESVANLDTNVSPYISQDAGAQTGGSVSCDAGKMPVGGGVIGFDDTEQSVNSSFPSGSGWTVYMNNTSGLTAALFRVYVICTKAATVTRDKGDEPTKER